MITNMVTQVTQEIAQRRSDTITCGIYISIYARRELKVIDSGTVVLVMSILVKS